MFTADDVEDMFGFLNDLQQSGAINMMGAAPHLQEYTGLSRRDSGMVLLAWMKNYDNQNLETYEAVCRELNDG